MQKQKDIYILGIESSCDETAAAVVKNGRKVLSNVISSQINLHKKFGGVVPEVASRKHVEQINVVIDEALEKAKISLEELDGIGITCGPGLVGALLVGLSAAKAIAYASGKPLIGIHHIEGHICANYIEEQELAPPFVCLVASGGHSHLVYVRDYTEFEILGQTRDDAAGEAFDKIARALGLGYPGGPLIDQLAQKGNSEAIAFPRAYLEEDSYDFSFSGLKSAVLNYLNQQKQKQSPIAIEDVAASFQQAVIEVLVDKTLRAARQKNVSTIALAGGVAANRGLRYLLLKRAEQEGFQVRYPAPILCTDNAAMIGAAAYFEYIKGISHDLSLNAIPGLKLGQKF